MISAVQNQQDGIMENCEELDAIIVRKRVISEAQAAAFCGLSLVHFRRLRRKGYGPRHIRLGERRIGYRVSDLDSWLEAHASVGSVA